MYRSTTNSSNYILGTGTKGDSNLDLQHEIFKDESIRQLEQAGLKEGMTVWDIGCGNGTMTKYLANKVGKKGKVFALDVSDLQLKIAQENIKTAGYNNVEFVKGDVSNTNNQYNKKADIVYARFLLMHVPNPKDAIAKMASLLKPGGKLSLQESSMSSVIENNTNPSIKRYFQLIIDYGNKNGFDYDVGRKLPHLCHDADALSDIEYYKKDYQTDDKIIQLLSSRLDELERSFIDAGLITKEEYEKLKLDVIVFLNSDEAKQQIIMSEQSHIVAIASKENK